MMLRRSQGRRRRGVDGLSSDVSATSDASGAGGSTVHADPRGWRRSRGTTRSRPLRPHRSIRRAAGAIVSGAVEAPRGGSARRLRRFAGDQPRAAVVGHVGPAPTRASRSAGCESRSGTACGRAARRARRASPTSAGGRSRPPRAAGRSSRASPCRGSGTAARGSPRSARTMFARGVPALLNRGRRDAGHRLAVLLQPREVADHEDLGWPGTLSSGSTLRRGPRDRAARRALRASGEAATPAAHSTVRAGDDRARRASTPSARRSP